MAPTSHPVLLLHGAGLDSSMWDRTAEALHSAGMETVLRLDLLGHGSTPRPQRPLHLDDYVRQVRRYLHDCEVERVVVIGHSLGGLVALALARFHPELVAGAVVIGVPFARSDEQRNEWLDIIMASAESGAGSDPGATVPAAVLLAERWLGENAPSAPAVVKRISTLDPVTFGLVFRIAMTSETVVEEMAPDIAVPVIVAAGDADSEVDAVGVDELARSLPAGTAQVLPGHRHLSIIDDPSDFVALLDRLF